MTLPFAMRIAVAKRILTAEVKLLAMLSDGGGHKDLLPHSGWTQEKIVLHDCIAPRLRRLKTSVFGPPQPNPALDRWDLAWILSLWRGERPGPTIKQKYRLDQIELMLNLVGNHGSFKPEFWAEIAQWQLRTYKERKEDQISLGRHPDIDPSSSSVCAKFLDDFEDMIAEYITPDDEYVQMCRSVVKTAVQRALTEPEPSPGDVTWTDVFATRFILQDPTLQATLDTAPALEGRPDRLDILVEDIVYQQPIFPPACRALKFE
ncbi:hypothetical protein FS837_001014 [Tulasnella sp. UAMH 9824]|nr:hypothetical protein FS837_001014 [Tulasnella sp. UAMH 9824]